MESNKQTSGIHTDSPLSNPGPYTPPTQEAMPNTFATASLVLGIIAILSFFTFTLFPPIVLGSLSIILAFLSRGASPQMSSMAKTGITTSVVAFVLNIAVFGLVFGLIFSNFEAIYGMTYEEMMERMENGTLDYNEIYDNIYNDLYEMLPNETPGDVSNPDIETPQNLDELYKEIHENR